jgi:hypothetical protein
VRFSHDLVNCHHCVGCVGLRHKSYCIFNKQYSKEDYFRKIKEFDFGSYGWVGEVKKRLAELKLRRPARYMHGRQNVNSSGDYLNNSKNANFCFISKNIEDSKYCQYILFVPGKDCYDSTVSGGEKSYENSIAGGYDVRFCWLVGGLRERSVDAQYSINCFNCSHIFGCVGLLNKNYCILNKQYTKEEYEKLVPKIIDHMMNMPYLDELGRVYRYGEFFPPQFSPYAYNETLAQEVKPLNKQAVFSLGFGWKDREADPPNITLKAEFLPDNIRDVSDSVIDEIIGCAHEGKCDEQCTVGFKILREELSFYRRMNLPLPRLCPNCRHFERLKQRNPLKLWHRKCQCAGNKKEEGGQRMGESRYHNTAQHFHGQNPCPNEFETSYAPDRPEIVYCEQCYNSEVV